MTATDDEILQTAIQQNASCTLSLPIEPIAAIRRSRVLHVDDDGVRLLLGRQDFALVEHLIAQSLPVHVTIRSDDGDLLFHSLPVSIDPNFITSDKRVAPSLLLKSPDKCSTSQRRKTFRVPVTPEDEVKVRLWRINEYVLVRDRPLPSQELRCEPSDLGEGGFGGVVCPTSNEALNLKFNQRFRTEILLGRHEILLEARLRHPEQTQRDDESAACGFEFVYNDRDVESRRHRQKLQLVLSEIQRLASRRIQS